MNGLAIHAKDILGDVPSQAKRPYGPKRKDKMTGQNYSYLNPKCESGSRAEKGGCGVFAREPIRKGELISLWGGRIVTADELDPNMPNFTQRILQVEEGLYLETPERLEPSDCFNHSCDPNVGLSGQIGVVAMRDIEPGEELSFDYAMCDSTPYDEFDCCCGSENCRGSVTGSDWMRPDLWEKYDGYFMPYLARRIEALKARSQVLA
ncbi:MAG TPA: SET domain-containing protein-lysine N-methyltransferase [Anaerolineales bacterium]|nr:SET domain-containing protein-lysine N-methyltransferase [Anaerolineales bacterium]